jgi:glycine betaine catabolism B
MAILPWIKGIVLQIKEETHNTKRFLVEVKGIRDFNFTPGQFVTLLLPIHEKANKCRRSYSIASWPDGKNVFELVIVLKENGAGTTYLFNEVNVGSELTFRGPQGVFTLKENDLENDLFFICTGTGIAPFRSMVHHIKNKNLVHKNIYLIFGTRTKSDLLYHKELCELQSTLTNFKYIPVLSREEWEGKSGYIHAVYEELCTEKQPAHFFLCGWKSMINDAKQRITDLGYDKKSIHLEVYG